MKQTWELSVQELEQELESSPKGLSENQAIARRGRYGDNVLKERKKTPVFVVFLQQFADLLVIILLIAAAISMISADWESAVVIIGVLFMNAVLGTVQHVKAQKSLDSLMQLSSPSTKVVRDGVRQEIPSREVVPGDLVILEAGDLITADGRIVQDYSLQVNESALTGEALGTEKTGQVLVGDLPLGDRKNMVFSGSLVTYGRAEVLVSATGMHTEIGKIAQLMNNVRDRKTPLQKSMDEFSKHLALFILVISAAVFGLCVYRRMDILDSFIFAVALAVAAIPEALSSIVTIVQAMGTQKMAAENAIIKELRAVESLGCVSVICTDKTGTLTQNCMTVRSIWTDGKVFTPKEIDITDSVQRYLLYDAILNNDASIAGGNRIGDPTEYALLEMLAPDCVGGDWNEEVIRQKYPRIEELPFDSDRKCMSCKVLLQDESVIFTKGAPDVLLDICTEAAGKNGTTALTKEVRAQIEGQNQRYSEEGLRVLAFAYRKSDEVLTVNSERNLIFLGMVAMMDPPRPESAQAVADARRAGIKPVMITGDHKVTAMAIGREIGILQDGDLALSGVELGALSEEELEAQIERISVYARVSPEHKIRIVRAWQQKCRVVSMTGDGVNDAPALKSADIGIAMGITGTEVAKDAASMILADDNFATIIKAVINGRNVYRNICNAILFLLSGNLAAILVVVYAALCGLPVPFTAVHLLFINLLTDSLPAIAIGMEPADEALLQQRPRNPKEGILNRAFTRKLLAQGTLIAAAVLASYYLGLSQSAALASTMAFATLSLARLFHGFNCRNNRSIYSVGLKSNPYSIYAFGGGVMFLAIALFVRPLHGIFAVTDMRFGMLLAVLGFAILPTFVIQLAKRRNEKIQK